VEYLRSENIKPHLFWYNFNIHPFLEFKSRLECFKEFAFEEDLKYTAFEDYELKGFLNKVFINSEKHCVNCYRVRLEKTARFASQEGYSAFTTTLLISPYQDHEAIKSIGEEMSNKYNVEFYYKDFRPLFREGQAAARSKGMYMQKYCGCIFSEEERYIKDFSQRKYNVN